MVCSRSRKKGLARLSVWILGRDHWKELSLPSAEISNSEGISSQNRESTPSQAVLEVGGRERAAVCALACLPL